MWKTWANLLTLLRLACILPGAWALLAGDWVSAAVLFVIAVVTDFFDGRLARRMGHVSALGGLFDHATDALFVSTMLFVLGVLDLVPLWLAPLVALAFVQYMFDSRALAGHALQASWIGRNNGIAYFVIVGVPVIRNALDLDWPADDWILIGGWVLVATTLVSMIDRAAALLKTRRKH